MGEGDAGCARLDAQLQAHERGGLAEALEGSQPCTALGCRLCTQGDPEGLLA